MLVPIANLSAVVTGAVHAAQAFAIEMLPSAVTREAMGASMAWLLRHLWSWLVAERGAAVENLPVAAAVARRAAGSAVEVSEPWLQMAAEFLHGLYVWLLAAIAVAVENLPDMAKNTVEYTVEASQPWLAVAAELLQGLYGWLLAAISVAVESLPGVAKNTVEYTVEVSQPWLAVAANLLQSLYGWLVAVSAVAVEMLPDAAKNAAGSAAEASQPWLAMASKLLQAHELCGRLVTAGDKVVENLPQASAGAAAAAMGGAADSSAEATITPMPMGGWFFHGHGSVAVYALLAVALLAVAFLGGAVCALTCRTMKGPGLGGARIPRAMFRASPRSYYAAVRTARKARRSASETGWKLIAAGVALVVACTVYLGAKMLYLLALRLQFCLQIMGRDVSAFSSTSATNC
ncbi:hypothetical protein E2562_020093 [Oryza meyeriana var. granulata]|uniref:Uncharacterized protein n=1 Tax=Oryza meyeriana var. granulata TaxID=110450 RepID=A0A6G1EAM6_9ORYZ|nr:hypothetical protein E2562_020093 [Oryza meyeriana var. granulata]